MSTQRTQKADRATVTVTGLPTTLLAEIEKLAAQEQRNRAQMLRILLGDAVAVRRRELMEKTAA